MFPGGGELWNVQNINTFLPDHECMQEKQDTAFPWLQITGTGSDTSSSELTWTWTSRKGKHHSANNNYGMAPCVWKHCSLASRSVKQQSEEPSQTKKTSRLACSVLLPAAGQRFFIRTSSTKHTVAFMFMCVDGSLEMWLRLHGHHGNSL